MYDFPLVNFNSLGGISHSSDSDVAVKLSATNAGADGVPTSSNFSEWFLDLYNFVKEKKNLPISHSKYRFMALLQPITQYNSFNSSWSVWF